MAVLFSPFGNQQFSSSGTALANGHKINTYAAGSSTPLTTYTDSTGATAQSNPIILNSLGMPTVGQIWLTSGLSYKLVWTDASDVVIKTEDNITGVTGAASISQWQASGLTPTYVSATSFTLAGDQTSNFQVNRRLQSTNTVGTIYSRISASVYTTLTTVTVVNDSGVLDSGLSAVNYGLLSATNPSIPETTVGKDIRTAASPAAARDALLIPAAFRSYLSGYTMSTAGSSATMSITAGAAADSTNVTSIIGSAISKTTASWAVGTGAGGLDTGAIAASTWYHFYAIRRPDTGVVDLTFSLSATTPTLPTDYTQYRRIGSGKTDGSSQWTSFKQNGDVFLWNVVVSDFNANAPTVGTLTTTTVPTGLNVEGIYIAAGNPAGNLTVRVSSPLVTDVAVTQTNGQYIGSSAFTQQAEIRVYTNTSAQVRIAGTTANNFILGTAGWRDTRGKDN